LEVPPAKFRESWRWHATAHAAQENGDIAAEVVLLIWRDVRLPPGQVKDFILGTGGSGGPAMFTDDELASLLECLPSQEEAEMLAPHAAEAAQLGVAENFLLAMLSIPQARARMHA
jgi:hypothetical protein